MTDLYNQIPHYVKGQLITSTKQLYAIFGKPELNKDASLFYDSSGQLRVKTKNIRSIDDPFQPSILQN